MPPPPHPAEIVQVFFSDSGGVLAIVTKKGNLFLKILKSNLEEGPWIQVTPPLE
jgi:hypothetical protein